MSPAPILKTGIELEKAFAHNIFKDTPKEVINNFGPMVLERVFPELQLDDKYLQFLINSGEDYDLVSNVTEETIPISQLNDHWIFPGGIQISKSTGAMYIPEKARANPNLYMSILESKFDDLVNVVDMDNIKPSKDRLIVKVTIKTTENNNLESEDGMSLSFAQTETITTLIFEAAEPTLSSSEIDAFTVVETSGESKLPLPIDGSGKSIKENLFNQIKHFFVLDEKAKSSSDGLLEMYSPVLISQDLIILAINDPSSEYKYVAFAKIRDKNRKTDPKQSWKHTKIKRKSNVPVEKTKWLAGLEKKNQKGSFLKGFNTVALTV
ncbi:hypothetical protein ACFLZK_00200 [Patescibacteria group bacterium]